MAFRAGQSASKHLDSCQAAPIRYVILFREPAIYVIQIAGKMMHYCKKSEKDGRISWHQLVTEGPT
jgi:hypothetical protein